MPLRSFAVLPLTVAGRTIGLFAAYRRSPRPFTIVDLADLGVFARVVAILALDRDTTTLPRAPSAPLSGC